MSMVIWATVLDLTFCLFKGPVLSEEQKQFNFQMSRVQEPVEWAFKEVTQQFEFLDFS